MGVGRLGKEASLGCRVTAECSGMSAYKSGVKGVSATHTRGEGDFGERGLGEGLWEKESGGGIFLGISAWR